jgi:mono/diheme cytochrome c family protein
MRPIRFSPSGIRFAFGVAVSGYALVGVFVMTGHAGQARPLSAGVYSAAQAKRGEQVYTDTCRSCHGKDLEGLEGPTLTGTEFMTNWAGLPVSDLVQKIQNTMPQDNPGTLSQQQATDVTAYILQTGKLPPGQADLSAASAAQVMFPGTRAAAPVIAAGGSIPLVVKSNLAQYMRAVTFPNANIIFNTQVKNPADDKGKPPVPFDYVQWGQVAYHGWQAVDNAAMALEETSALFLLPGRKCQNGRPVPINKPDYQRYTRELMDFAKEIQRVALTRNVEAVAALSEKLNDTCANCHKVYRDVQPAGAPQSSSLEGGIASDRCKQ